MNNPMKRMVSVSVALAVSVAALPIATFSEEQLSLDGEWRFSFEGGEERMMPVPSCWELQGERMRRSPAVTRARSRFLPTGRRTISSFCVSTA